MKPIEAMEYFWEPYVTILNTYETKCHKGVKRLEKVVENIKRELPVDK